MRYAITAVALATIAGLSPAGIIQSVTYTPQSGVNIDIDFDTLQPYGKPLVDWMIYDEVVGDPEDDLNGLVYTELAGADYLQTPSAATDMATSVQAYDFTWTSGTPIAAGSDVQGLGYTGGGSIEFRTTVPSDFGGFLRLYVNAVIDDTYTIISQYGGDDEQIVVSAGTHGYIEVTFHNDALYADAVIIRMSSAITQEASFYASAVGQVPEPSTLLLLIAGLPLLRRRGRP